METSKFDRAKLDKLIALAEVLTRKRMEKGLTLREAADQSGVHYVTIGRLERAKIDEPSFIPLVKLGQLYGLTPNQIARILDLLPEPSPNNHA